MMNKAVDWSHGCKIIPWELDAVLALMTTFLYNA